jgi:single-strand DNA-binding protein
VDSNNQLFNAAAPPGNAFSFPYPFVCLVHRLEAASNVCERAWGERLASRSTISISILKGERTTMSFNKITIVGYLGRDPELRYTPQGTAVCNFSVATTEKRKNAKGETEEHTVWFRITAWGRQAELAAEYLAKGRQVYVEGRLRLEQYTDRDGNPRTSPEVNANDIQFLGQRADTAERGAERTEENGRGDDEMEEEVGSKSTSSRVGKKQGSKRASRKEAVNIEEDDVPF